MTKIEALEKTIYNLENDVYKYKWSSCNHCSCGVIAQTLLGEGKKPTDSLFNLYDVIGTGVGFHGAYEDALNYCQKTGIPLPEVVRVLHEAGFTPEEMNHLELCSTKESVISLMKQMVSKGQNVQASVATKMSKEKEAGTKIIHHYHKVTVPESIETKELILS